MKLTTLCLSIALYALLNAGSATAADLYQIELVVFARDSADAEVEERWDRDYGLRYPGRLVGLLPEDAPAPVAPADDTAATPAATPAPVQPFQLLPAAQLRLAAEARTIDRRSNLRVLFHGAWVQPGGSLGSADPVLVSGGNSYGNHRELEGYITLTVDRYLHLDANLWMSRFAITSGIQSDGPVLPMPVVTTGHGAEPGHDHDHDHDGAGDALPVALEKTVSSYAPAQIYVLEQERRMRNGETHYLDHPRFGMLVQVIPYKLPEPAEAPAPTPPAAAPVNG